MGQSVEVAITLLNSLRVAANIYLPASRRTSASGFLGEWHQTTIVLQRGQAIGGAPQRTSDISLAQHFLPIHDRDSTHP